MSHYPGATRRLYGNHTYFPDTALKRYNRAHCGDTVIFNYNSGNTYNCCGGCGGGFWGGLGAGIGLGFGNLLGGLFGGFSNMFSGFGMGGMFGGFGNMFGGFGMGNMFGGFGIPSWGNYGNWGFGGSSAAGSNGNPITKTVTKEVPVDDKDYAEINKLSAEADQLINDIADGKIDNPNEKIDALIKKLQDYKKLDEANTADNDKQIGDIIARLNEAKTGLPAQTVVKPAPITQPQEVPQVVPADINALTQAQAKEAINQMSGAELGKISLDDAKKYLKQLGLWNGNENSFVTFPANGNVRILYLIQKSGLKANVAQNSHPNAIADEGFVRGKISELKVGGKDVTTLTKEELDSASGITYKVDNSTVEGDYGLTYTFTQNPAVQGFNITEIHNTGRQTYYVKTNFENRVYSNSSNQDGPLSINASEVLVSQWQQKGYELLKIGSTKQ